jgi:hypothetical protein
LEIELDQAEAVTLSSVEESSDPYLVVNYPLQNEVVTVSDITALFVANNCTLSDSDCGIKVTVDTEPPVILRTVPELDIESLSDGSHVITAELVDVNGATLSTADPAVTINSPFPNAVIIGSSLEIDYDAINIPVGGGVYYAVDSGSAVLTDGSGSVVVPLSSGAHTITVFVGDALGEPIVGYLASVDFEIVMNNRFNIDFSLFVGAGSVSSFGGIAVADTTVPINTANMYFGNIHAPIDAKLVLSDNSVGDSQSYSVIMAKVATKSYLNSFAEDGLAYQDGFSVVEYGLTGQVVLSNNDAIFARNKEEAKSLLGSVHKGAEYELYIGDA